MFDCNLIQHHFSIKKNVPLLHLNHPMAPGRRAAEARLLAKDVVAQAQRNGRKAQKIWKNSGSRLGGARRWEELAVLVWPHWRCSKRVRLNVPPNVRR